MHESKKLHECHKGRSDRDLRRGEARSELQWGQLYIQITRGGWPVDELNQLCNALRRCGLTTVARARAQPQPLALSVLPYMAISRFRAFGPSGHPGPSSNDSHSTKTHRRRFNTLQHYSLIKLNFYEFAKGVRRSYPSEMRRRVSIHDS